jgi:cytidine deaminase
MAEAEGSSLEEGVAERLLASARAVRANAYAPYSNFQVGAALLADDGRVFTGVNVENASYGLTTCAERTAMSTAVAQGARAFRAIAVVGPEDDVACPPCGSCRQILHELGREMVVVMASEGGRPLERKLSDLLPGAFGVERLGEGR